MAETKEEISASEVEVDRWERETLEPTLSKTPETKQRFESVSLEEVQAPLHSSRR